MADARSWKPSSYSSVSPYIVAEGAQKVIEFAKTVFGCDGAEAVRHARSATFLCSLVAGFLFAFAVVVMPGIRRLDHGDFMRAFQAIDRVIQAPGP